jgi:hypothetical protein
MIQKTICFTQSLQLNRRDCQGRWRLIVETQEQELLELLLYTAFPGAGLRLGLAELQSAEL